MFSYEVHLHSCGCSKCGRSTASEMVEAAAATGYAGVVFTNHFFRGNTCVDRELPWEEFAAHYRDDYLAALETGRKLDVDVLFGIEENFGGGHEALIYGLSPEDFIGKPELANMQLPELAAFVRSRGGVIFCAHPFRDRGYITDPYIEPDMRYFDGVEAYNLFNTPETNRMAAEFARRFDTRIISGGDVHNAVNFGQTGLAFPERVKDNAALVKALLSGEYALLIGGKPYARGGALELILNMA